MERFSNLLERINFFLVPFVIVASAGVLLRVDVIPPVVLVSLYLPPPIIHNSDEWIFESFSGVDMALVVGVKK